MNGRGCTEMHLLIQADLDGELDAATAARVAAHLPHCAACSALQSELSHLSANIRREAARFPAPSSAWAGLRPAGSAGVRRRHLGGYAMAAALAACLTIVVMRPLPEGGTADLIVAEHIRALQPGHLLDVTSTDQHNVKPWFDGRLDLAPPVKDLRAYGFELVGGRLDYAGGRNAAALVYRRRQHLIDLFVWPEAGSEGHSGARQGYNFITWHDHGMAFWAVSDLNAGELGDFASHVQRS